MRFTATLDQTGNAFSGSGTVLAVDFAGNVLFEGAFTLVAGRFEVD